VAADRVDVALLVERLRRDLLSAVTPDDVLEDVADVLGLVERGQDRVHSRRPDLMASFDQVRELVDDGPRLRDVRIVALEGQAVAAQQDLNAQAVAERVEHAVVESRELRRDVVRDRENFLHARSV
jgi:hypothetical protein